MPWQLELLNLSLIVVVQFNVEKRCVWSIKQASGVRGNEVLIASLLLKVLQELPLQARVQVYFRLLNAKNFVVH